MNALLQMIGTKKQVWYSDSNEMHTAGGLYKKDLCLNRRNKVVSKRRSELSKANVSRLRAFQFQKATIKDGQDKKSLDVTCGESQEKKPGKSTVCDTKASQQIVCQNQKIKKKKKVSKKIIS